MNFRQTLPSFDLMRLLFYSGKNTFVCFSGGTNKTDEVNLQPNETTRTTFTNHGAQAHEERSDGRHADLLLLWRRSGRLFLLHQRPQTELLQSSGCPKDKTCPICLLK